MRITTKCSCGVSETLEANGMADMALAATRWRERHHADVEAERDQQRERAERAEAALAGLRERVRGMVDNAEARALRDVNGTAFGGWVATDDLRDLLDDDTTGAASGEGEK